jgi:tRNA(adenine34) deaminase
MIFQVSHLRLLSGNDVLMTHAFSDNDILFMQHAVTLAKKARDENEVPVGAVIVLNNEIIAEGYNRPITTHDPTAHAEIIALRLGAERIGNYRLVDATLYVTLEPCLMCAGAMVHARIKQLKYGALDPRAGAVVSKAQVLDHSFLNHRVQHAGGLQAEVCGQLLSEFFKIRRGQGRVYKKQIS